MSPITHFLVGWTVLERFHASNRDKAIVVLAGLAPDIDGTGIIIDFMTRALGLTETNYYQDYHRLLGHGLPFALLLAALAATVATERLRVAISAFVCIHLHFLCDLIGSRGSTIDDIWPIHYLSPLSATPALHWAHQWPLVGWQNMLISVVLMAITLQRATRRGYSPLALFSAKADQVLVATLQRWKACVGDALH